MRAYIDGKISAEKEREEAEKSEKGYVVEEGEGETSEGIESETTETEDGKETLDEESVKTSAEDGVIPADIQDRARRAVRDFDLLGPEERSAIAEMIQEADSVKISDAAIRFTAQVMSKRKGLRVHFRKNVKGNGFHYIMDDGRRLVVVKSGGSSPVRALLHEMFHDISLSKAGKKIIEFVKKHYETELEECKKNYQENYKREFDGKEVGAELLEEEAVADFLASHLDKDPYIRRMIGKNQGFFRRAGLFLMKFSSLFRKSDEASRISRALAKKYAKALNTLDTMNGSENKAAEDRGIKKSVKRTNEENVQVTGDGQEVSGISTYDENSTGIRFALPEVDYDKPITVEDVRKLRSIGRKSINDFTSEDIAASQKWAHKFYKELGTKSPFFRSWFGDWRAHQKNEDVTVADIPAYIATNEARKTQRGTVTNADTKWDIRISREGETNTISHSGEARLSEYGLAGIRSLLENAILLNTEVHEHHSNNAKNDLIAFDHKLYSLGKDTYGNIAVYRITVEESYHDQKHTNERAFHNLKYIEKVATVGGRTAGQSLHGVSTNDDIATTYSISDLYNFVKTYDKEFYAAKAVSTLLLEEYTDEDGDKRIRPKVVYHGTNSDFWSFDLAQSGKNYEGTSEGFFFFTSEKSGYPDSAQDYARSHTKKHSGKERIVPVYLHIEKPLVLDSKGYYTPAAYFDSHADEIYMKYLQGDYDGVIIENSDKNADTSVIYLLDDATRIKSATDNIGTFDRENPDIRYSVSSESDKPKSSEMSRGQKAKFVSNNTKMKKYSRKDAEATIDKILEEIVYGDESQEWQAKLSRKNREEAISMLFEELNRADPDRRGGVALRALFFRFMPPLPWGIASRQRPTGALPLAHSLAGSRRSVQISFAIKKADVTICLWRRRRDLSSGTPRGNSRHARSFLSLHASFALGYRFASTPHRGLAACSLSRRFPVLGSNLFRNKKRQMQPSASGGEGEI